MTDGQQKNVDDLVSKLDQVSRQLNQNNQKLDRVLYHLHGNGTPERGIIVRLDRLEQDHDKKRKALWATLTAALMAAAHGLWQILTKAGK